MGISVYYSGKLALGKTVDELVSHLEALAGKQQYRTLRPEQTEEGGTFKFRIPKHVMEQPDASFDGFSHQKRIVGYAQRAGLPYQGISHRELCRALNGAEFRQVGLYVWAHKLAEPLKFLFVEGNPQLTRLRQEVLEGENRFEKPIRSVDFQSDGLSTKTWGEYVWQAHQNAVNILREANRLYFGGRMRINGDSK